jgi:hypothetical protein
MDVLIEPSPPHWLRSLRDQAQAWIATNTHPQYQPPTDAYADLIFSFGLASLGEAEAAVELMDRARRELAARRDDVHSFLCEGYCYRVRQALGGEPHAGPLPQRLMDTLQQMGSYKAYIIDRLRSHSLILEPDQRIDPYGEWARWASALENHLGGLPDVTEQRELTTRVGTLLDRLPVGYDSPRWRSLQVALDLAPKVGAEFADEMLGRALTTYDALPEPANIHILAGQVNFLGKALALAVQYNRREHIDSLVARFERLVHTPFGNSPVQTLNAVAGQSFLSLREVGMYNEMDRLLTPVAERVLAGEELSAVNVSGMEMLLQVSAEWSHLGRDARAERVLQAAWTMLRRCDLDFREQSRLGCAYARAVGTIPLPLAQKRLEEIFTSLEGVRDLFTTSTHFSASQLDLIEAVVLAGVAAARRGP